MRGAFCGLFSAAFSSSEKNVSQDIRQVSNCTAEHFTTTFFFKFFFFSKCLFERQIALVGLTAGRTGCRG